MEVYIIISIFGFVFFIILALLASERTEKPNERILRALDRVESNPNQELPSLQERVIRPGLHRLTSIFSRFISQKAKDRTRKELGAIGLKGQWDGSEWKGLQFGLGILLSLMLLILFSLLHTSRLNLLMVLALGFVIGYIFPRSWLKAQAKRRLQEIEKCLPDVLDLLTVSVEAGLGFDAAVLKVVEKQKGALADEFLKVLQEIKMGRPRRDALRDLSNRNPIEDLGSVVASLVQADQLGIPIGGVLRNQSKQIRQKHRQRAEEKAQKAPVKMMIPLVFFVFPSIFIVILGPAVIQITQMFK